MVQCPYAKQMRLYASDLVVCLGTRSYADNLAARNYNRDAGNTSTGTLSTVGGATSACCTTWSRCLASLYPSAPLWRRWEELSSAYGVKSDTPRYSFAHLLISHQHPWSWGMNFGWVRISQAGR